MISFTVTISCSYLFYLLIPLLSLFMQEFIPLWNWILTEYWFRSTRRSSSFENLWYEESWMSTENSQREHWKRYLKQLPLHMTTSLADEGIKVTLEQFIRSCGYRVEKIDLETDIDVDSSASEMKRGPSAARFRCLISNTTDGNKFLEGDYYEVTSRSINGWIDIVFINYSGNIACTSPSYARWGLPSKNVLAVFYNGRMCLNWTYSNSQETRVETLKTEIKQEPTNFIQILRTLLSTLVSKS